jgi:hypothetical protein
MNSRQTSLDAQMHILKANRFVNIRESERGCAERNRERFVSVSVLRLVFQMPCAGF